MMARSEEQSHECPLCMELLEIDDLNFYPCTCGYQICRFCWHRIRTNENGLCPACRKQYPEDPADFKPVSVEEVQRIKNEKRQKDLQKRQKVSDKRKSLSQVRVVQNNLVFVVGLPPRLADPEILKKLDYFGKYGRLHKIVVNNCTSYAGSQGPSASAYVTYEKAEDALHALRAVNNIHVDGRPLKASLGTTKYCSHFLRNQQCPKPDCMYLHEFGAVAGSFTKEEMQQGKHQDYERKLIEQILDVSSSHRKTTVSSSSEEEETWPLPSENQSISGNKVHGDQTKQTKSEHDVGESGLCEISIPEQRKSGKSSCYIQNCTSTEKLSGAQRRNSLLDELQCKLEDVHVSGSSSSRESLYSTNSDGQVASINTMSSSEKSDSAKSDSDYETDKTDREVQHELFAVERPRNTLCSESPDFFSSNSSLSTPDSSVSDGPLPFSPSSSPVVNSHLQGFPPQNCSETSEPRPYCTKNIGMPPGFGHNTLESNEPSSVSLNSHTGWDLFNHQDTNGINIHSQSIPDSSHDDDLGFDPFDESNKGLADLLKQEAKEQAVSTTKVKNNSISTNGIEGSTLNCSFTHPLQLRKMPPPGFAPSTPINYNTTRSPFLNETTMPILNNHPQRIPQNPMRELGHQEIIPNEHLLNQVNFPPSPPPGALNFKLNKMYSKEFQEGFKALLPNINITFDSSGRTSGRVPPGLAPSQKVNSQREEYPWLHDPAIISSGNVTNGSTWPNSSQWYNSQLIAEETARKYNSYINAYYRSIPARANHFQPPVSAHTPPPGFNVPFRPMQTFPENGKVNDSHWYFGRM